MARSNHYKERTFAYLTKHVVRAARSYNELLLREKGRLTPLVSALRAKITGVVPHRTTPVHLSGPKWTRQRQ